MNDIGLSKKLLFFSRSFLTHWIKKVSVDI